MTSDRGDSTRKDVRREFEEWCADYQNMALVNGAVFRTFAERVQTVPWLAAHRDWVEAHRHGYGHRAFHYLWYLLIASLGDHFRPVRMLEIGVFKGQITSLVALLGRELDVPVEITALSPFMGDREAGSGWRSALKFVVDSDFRRSFLLGNVHRGADHVGDNRRIFEAFGLDFDRVRMIRGLSTSPDIAAQLRGERLAVVFIDGDHSYDVARSDIETYTPLVEPGGYAVVDDAGCDLPGRGFSKGFRSVSRACRVLETSAEWSNVLNVGKMRVFSRRGAETAGRRF
ncbi:MAG TPA: class I SAM-dependent methyltransferase [Polyangiaceae bacterium]